MKYYKLKVLELERDLPILKAPSGINIAGFNLVGDMELLNKSGEFLAEKVRSHNIPYDIILTTEVKGIPVAQEIARNLGCDYVCLRKEKKCYMLNPISITSESITSGKSQYFLSETDLNKLINKNVIFVDDVLSTGGTLNNMLKFAKDYKFKINSSLFVLKEGIKGKDEDLEFNYNDTRIICCQFLPLP